MTSALMVDVDSTIPNLALMHISTWRKSLGIETGWSIKDPDEVWASCVFHKNAHKVDGLRFFYPNAKIDVGGGISLQKSLPPEVDLMMPDYSLYPDCTYDVGFTSRGCNRKCYFCVVPRKEGGFHIHQHPSEFHDPSHKDVMLLDNNILFDKTWFFEVTDWLLDNDLRVDFNQGLDLRLMDKDIARRIVELRPTKIWHFAFDSMDYRDAVESGLKMLADAGLNIRSKVNVYVYLHGDEQYADALERCEILRSLGTLPYIMVNRDAPRTQRMTDLKRWTRPHIFFSTDFEAYCRSNRKGGIGMIPEFPTAFSPEQARTILSTLKLRARCPKLWSGAILYFSGTDLRPGIGDDSRYAMMYLRKDRSDSSAIGAEWTVIDDDKRSDNHHTFASIRHDAKANAFNFLGARQTIQVPVNGSLGIEFNAVKPCIQHTLEEFA